MLAKHQIQKLMNFQYQQSSFFVSQSIQKLLCFLIRPLRVYRFDIRELADTAAAATIDLFIQIRTHVPGRPIHKLLIQWIIFCFPE